MTAVLQRYGANAGLLVVPLFFILNSSLNMLNRYALGIYGFKFPLLLTCCHALFGFLAMAPLVLLLGRWGQYRSTLRKQWKGILAVGLCLAANIAFNNLSLVYITLSLNQVIRACIPVVTAILGAALDRRLPKHRELGALCVLCTGVCLAIAEASAHGSLGGVLICMAGVLSGASMLVTSNRVLSEKLDVVQLAFFTSPITCLALLPVVLYKESAAFQRYLAADPNASGAAALIILLGSLIAALYNIVHYAMVQTTSPVTTCVFGQVKVIGLLILSSAFLGESKEFTLRMSGGCVLALLGFGAYSWIKLLESSSSKKQAQSSSSSSSAAAAAGSGAATAVKGGRDGAAKPEAGYSRGEEQRPLLRHPSLQRHLAAEDKAAASPRSPATKLSVSAT